MVPQSLQSPQQIKLAVRKMFQEAEDQQAQYVAPVGVAAIGDFFEQDAAYRERSREGVAKQQELESQARAEAAHEGGDNNGEVAGQLHYRLCQFKDQHVRQKEEANAAITAAEEHVAVAPERVHEPLLPAGALTGQGFEVGRHFRPAGGIRYEADVIFHALLPQIAVQAHNQVNIFSDSLRTKTANAEHQVAAEDAKGAGNDGQHVEVRPGFPSYKKSAQVLDDLKNFDRPAGEGNGLQAPSADRTAVEDTHDAACGHGRAGVGKNAGNDAHQGIAFQQGIGVHHADKGRVARVQSGIDGVRLVARGFFVHNHEPGLRQAFVEALDASGSNLGHIENVRGHQLVPLCQPVEGCIG